MEVKFDIVRFGVKRKNYSSETILKQNAEFLKLQVRNILKDFICEFEKISIVMIIPAKGYNIKISLKDIHSNQVKSELRRNLLHNSIYNGEYSKVLDNIGNKVFN